MYFASVSVLYQLISAHADAVCVNLVIAVIIIIVIQ